MKDVKIPGQINFSIEKKDELKNKLVEVMTRYSPVQKDKLYTTIFERGLDVILNNGEILNVDDFK